MDEIVLRAMARWPNVPAVYGWLALNRRGRWLIKGEPVTHDVMAEFIGRNYTHDASGRWYFQNGPQRVYVTLAYTPLILRMPDGVHLVSHTGRTARSVRGAWIDSDGTPIVDTEHGPGVIDDRDAEAFSGALAGPHAETLDDDALIASLERLQQGERSGLRMCYAGQQIELLPIEATAVPVRLGFVRDPQPGPGEEACP